MSTPEKRVLAQDMPQYLQNTEKQRREREKADQAQYEADLAQYQKDQAEYERQQAEYERQQAEAKQEAENYNKKSEAQQRADELAEKFRNQRLELEAKRGQALAEKREILKSQGLSRKQIELELNKIANKYESQINKVKETERIVVGEASFYAENPGKRIDTSVLRSFREGGNLSQLQEKKDLAREAKTQYTKAGQVTTARSEAGKIQSVMASIGTIQGSYGLKEGAERAAAIKPTPETTAGKKATETRRPLINVDVGQSIMGGQKYSEPVKVTTTENRYQIQTDDGVKTFKTMETAQKYADKKQITEPVKPVIRDVTRTIPGTPESRGISPKTNPLAFITGLSRQEVSSSTGLPAEQKTVFSFQNILDVKEESGRALLEFQSQLKTRTAPSATVYKGILEERGLPVTPLSKRIIDTFSSKGIFRDYKEPVAAKGKKGIISKDGKQIFDMETGEGSVRIGRMLGYTYTKQSAVVGETGPQLPKSFGIVGPLENLKVIDTDTYEQVKVSAPYGDLQFMVETGQLTPNPKSKYYKPQSQGPQQPKSLSGSGERFEFLLNKIEKTQLKYTKYNDDVGVLLHAGLEFGKDIVAGSAYVENLLWEGEALVRGGERKTRNIIIPKTVTGVVIEKPLSALSNIQQYETEYGKGSTVGAFGSLVLPIPGGKVKTPKLIIKTGRYIDEKLRLAEKYDVLVKNPKTWTKGKFVKGQWVYPRRVGTRQTRREELVAWEKLTPRVQQEILTDREYRRRLGPFHKEIEALEEMEKYGVSTPTTSRSIVPKITSEITIKAPPRVLTLTQGQPYNLERDVGNASDLPRMGSKPDLRKGTSIDYNELFGKDRQPLNYHAFIGESKSVGGKFQGTNINLGIGTTKRFTPDSVSPPVPPKPSLPPKPPVKIPDEKGIPSGKSGMMLILEKPKTVEIKQKTEFKIYPIRLEGEGKTIKIQLKRKKEKKPEPYLLSPQPITYTTYETIQYPPSLQFDVLQEQSYKLDTRLTTRQIQKLDTRLTTRQIQKLDLKFKPILVPKTILKEKEEQRNLLRQKYKYREPERFSYKTKLSAIPIQSLTPKLAQPQLLKPVQLLTLRTPTNPPPPKPPLLTFTPPPERPTENPPKRPKIALLPNEKKIPKSVLQKQKERADFLGASSELQISGVFKRAEITYGQKKISRLLKGDVRVVSGKTRNTKRGPIKWTEGKKGDMFGFKNEAKKKSKMKKFW